MVDNSKRASLVIHNWLRNKNTLAFLGVWEKLFNPIVKGFKFEAFYNEAGLDSFAISVSEWLEETEAIGLRVKRGRGGGTYAHRDIAFVFGSRISQLYLIRDYIQLKEHRRFLSKVNYRLQTEMIKDRLLPALKANNRRDWIIYAEEADMLNMAVFGLTAKEWRQANPELAKKENLRDAADLTQLQVLSNLESLNSVLIGKHIDKYARFELLAETAVSQYQKLTEDPRIQLLLDGE